MFFCQPSKRTIPISVWTISNWQTNKQNISPTWKILIEDVDLGETISCLDHVYLGCTQRESQISKDIVYYYRNMCESRISVGATESCQKQNPRCNLMPKRYLLGPMTWKVTQRNVWKDIANFRIKRLNNKTKSQSHAWEQLENYPLFAHRLFWNVFFLARIGRPDILWSVNKLARAVTKWTKACDKRLARLISYIHHTCEFRQYCFVRNTAQHCRLRLFQNSDFARDLADSKSTSGGFGGHTFVPIRWKCKKQISVSHSSTVAEVSSLDAGLRMDGIPALDLWDLVKKVFHSSPNQSNNTKDQV